LTDFADTFALIAWLKPRDNAPMNFKYDEVLDLWITEQQFLDYEVQVRLYCSEDADFPNLANEAMKDVASHWQLLKTAIVAELLPHYKEHSNNEIGADDFFARLVLKTIDFDAVDVMYILFWADSGLFGGHSIQVHWDPETEFDADVSLVG
jgi:hypothetical protein